MSTLASWTVSPTELTRNDKYTYAAYSDDPAYNYPDCIFVFGGTNVGNSIYCYNISTNSLYKWDHFSVDSTSTTYEQRSPHGSLFISTSNNDILW